MIRNLKKFMLVISLLPLLSYALPTDNQQPTNIQADSAILDHQNNTGTFIGHVIVTQGTTRLTADKLITFAAKNNKITRAIAYGNPARYQTQPKPNEKIFYASANTIEYFAATGNIILIGNGELIQGNNTFSAPYITYNQKTGVVSSKQENNQRTKIVIIPATLSNNQAGQSS